MGARELEWLHGKGLEDDGVWKRFVDGDMEREGEGGGWRFEEIMEMLEWVGASLACELSGSFE